MDIEAWLRELGLERYGPAFRDNDVEADILPKLTAEDLLAIGVTSVGHRRKLLEAIASLAGKPDQPMETGVPVEKVSVAAPTTSQAERRQLTVLFCDLVGSTELSARLDPEDLRHVMRAYQDACAAVLKRWDGHVAKFLGDGVLAYFGYPSAHEDDAERAVRAGLDLTAAVGDLTADGRNALAARVGIATGLVVVGDLIGEGAAQEEAVVGETPNLAARLEALATSGTVVIAPSTRKLVGGLFDLVDLGDHELKGFAAPVQAWRAVGERAAQSRFEALRGGRLTPLVGRERELEVLTSALEQAAASKGQIVAAVGDPGVGKSRLFRAFLRADAVLTWRVLSCGCRPYGINVPWLPVVELIKDYFGIEDRDDQQQVIAKIKGGLVSFGAVMQPAQTPLLTLLDLPVEDHEWQVLNPPQRRRRTLDAVKWLLQLESERAPLLLVGEDLHWADDETLALLDSLVDSLPTHRMLLLVNYRTEFEHHWGGRTYYSQLRIDPLGVDSAEQLLAVLLGEDASLTDLKRNLIERTAGNPLFLEEAVRDLAETGVLTGEPGIYRLTGEVETIRLPETVQAILAARIDRLTPTAKQLLQRAAVIGQEVPLPVLEAVADLPLAEVQERLGELHAAEMLYETRLFPDVEHTFKHALTHEVAYRSLLRVARATLHRRVGEAIEALYPERLGEVAEALSGHFQRGRVWSKAARYALDAAEKAKSRYAYRVGMRFAERAYQTADQDQSLGQEWIWANVLLGDLASLIGDLNLANESYDQALTKSKDAAEQRWIGNKRHQPHFAIRDAAKIAYYEHGSGSETLLFMSPIGYGLAPWQPVVERLCQEFRVVTIDPRGTGRSDPLLRPYRSKDHGLDIAAVVRRAGEGQVIAIGLSRGGAMMTHAAAQEPALFKKLVLVGTTAGPPVPGHPLFEQINEERQLLEDGQRERALRLFATRTISEPGTEDLQDQRFNAFLRLPEETIRSFYDPRPPSDSEIIAPLRDLRIPTLIMHGTADKRVPFDDGRRLAESVETAQLYAFEGRCHVCTLTATEEFCEVLREFVRTGAVSGTPAHSASGA